MRHLGSVLRFVTVSTPAFAIAFLAVSAVAAPSARADVQSVVVPYEAGGVKLVGQISYDDQAKGKRPGVLVVHEWWGLNDYAKRRAVMLAQAGYVAFAVDMYGEGKHTEHPDEAKAFATAAIKDFDVAKMRFLAALEILRKDPHCDPTRVAAIGYCFGGGVVLNMARQGVDLKGVVSFHGSLNPVKPAEKGAVVADLLVCAGAKDPTVPKEVRDAFAKEMDDAEARYTLVVFSHAKHAFTNPAAGSYGIGALGYDAEADQLSWKLMLAFFDRIFRA